MDGKAAKRFNSLIVTVTGHLAEADAATIKLVAEQAQGDRGSGEL